MLALIKLKSKKLGELNDFLSKYYNIKLDIENKYVWNKEYQNPIEIADLIGTYVDNLDKYKIKMWISLDKGIFIAINENNADILIKYLYERYPY